MVSVVGLIAARLVPPTSTTTRSSTLIEALPADKVHTMGNGEIKDALQQTIPDQQYPRPEGRRRSSQIERKRDRHRRWC